MLILLRLLVNLHLDLIIYLITQTLLNNENATPLYKKDFITERNLKKTFKTKDKICSKKVHVLETLHYTARKYASNISLHSFMATGVAHILILAPCP